jgi:aryl-alcohol dehydrogenase-like predicted oxidoreductase
MRVSPIGFGAFKIGRNQKTKYGYDYELPSDRNVERLLNGILDLGINLIDTAPAYGVSERQIGRWLSSRRDEYILSTKVGERFVEGKSHYDFSRPAVRESIEQSLRHLRTDRIDIALIHSNGQDLEVLQETGVVESLQELRAEGLVRAIGFSGRDPVAEEKCLAWADLLMVEYHVENTLHADVIRRAGAAGVGVLVKKGLASGKLPPPAAIPHTLINVNVCSLIIGGLNLEHFRESCSLAPSLSVA